MKPVNASSPARNRLVAAAVLSFILLTVFSLSTIFHAPPALAQTRAYQLASTNTLKTNDYFIVDIADAGSATGYRTMRIPYSTLLSILQSNVFQTLSTNSLTNGFVFPTNLLSDDYLSNLFQTEIFVADSYISNWFATNGALLSTNAPTSVWPSNVFGLDAYMSNWFDGHLIQTNTYASNWYGTNLIQTVNITSNYITTNVTHITELTYDVGNVGTLNATNVAMWYSTIRTLNATNVTLMTISNPLMSANQYVKTDGSNVFRSTLDGALWTNLPGAQVVGAVPQATHSTNADLATSSTGASYATNWTGLAQSNAFAGSFTGDAAGATNASGGFGGYGTLYTADSSNVVLNASGVMYSEINPTNSLNFAHCTNGPGAISLTIYPSGADRLLSFPTNWFWLSTNGFTLSGSLWTLYATNGEVAFLSLRKRSSGSDGTNVVARLARSQR